MAWVMVVFLCVRYFSRSGVCSLDRAHAWAPGHKVSGQLRGGYFAMRQLKLGLNV